MRADFHARLVEMLRAFGASTSKMDPSVMNRRIALHRAAVLGFEAI